MSESMQWAARGWCLVRLLTMTTLEQAVDPGFIVAHMVNEMRAEFAPVDAALHCNLRINIYGGEFLRFEMNMPVDMDT